MSFCRNCGTQMVEGAAFCIKCGTADIAAMPYQSIVPQQPKKPGLGYGISSMAVGIIGLFYSFVIMLICISESTYDTFSVIAPLGMIGGMPLVAVILSGLSMKCGRNNGFSKAGLITGLIGLVFVLITVAFTIVFYLMNVVL